ncbi:hypothetical protein SK128_003964, partial [Halocaridina rubra]
VLQSVDGILKAESALHLAEVEAAASAWDGEVRQVSKHADNLVQLDNGIKVRSRDYVYVACFNFVEILDCCYLYMTFWILYRLVISRTPSKFK